MKIGTKTFRNNHLLSLVIGYVLVVSKCGYKKECEDDFGLCYVILLFSVIIKTLKLWKVHVQISMHN